MRAFNIFIIVLMSLSCLLATTPEEWSTDATSLLEPGQRQIGVFQPWRIGLSERVEISTHPFLFLAIPNMSLKLQHGDFRGIQLGSRHAMTYPSLLLNLLAKEGIGGIISPEFQIPPILHHKSEVLLSREISHRFSLNLKAGLAVALKADNLDSRTSIDLPLIYPRWATWYSGYGLITGAEVIYRVSKRLSLQTDLDIHLHSDDTGGMAFEHKSLLHISGKPSRRFSIGYILTYAEYPFGQQAHFLTPIMDFQWSWKKN